MVLVRLITLECIRWNVRLFGNYVSSKDNDIADALSRGRPNKLLEYRKNWDALSTSVPEGFVAHGKNLATVRC